MPTPHPDSLGSSHASMLRALPATSRLYSSLQAHHSLQDCGIPGNADTRWRMDSRSGSKRSVCETKAAHSWPYSAHLVNAYLRFPLGPVGMQTRRPDSAQDASLGPEMVNQFQRASPSLCVRLCLLCIAECPNQYVKRRSGGLNGAVVVAAVCSTARCFHAVGRAWGRAKSLPLWPPDHAYVQSGVERIFDFAMLHACAARDRA